MNTEIVVLLLLGFSICVTVGLLSVLQNLVSVDYVDDTADLSAPGSLLHDAEQGR